MIVRDFILQERSERVKQLALSVGFDACGISEAGFLEVQAPRLENWLKNGNQGTMAWMENHFDKRLDPRLLVEGTRSVVSVLLNYYPERRLSEGEGDLKISKYAYGADYHDVLKSKLRDLMVLLQEEFGEIQGRVFVDSAPVMDKVWAEKSGLGWIGKNSNLINKGSGSFYFIGELLIDLELAADNATTDYCGTCTRCIDACPTDAIVSPYIVDGSKCISYYTIELKEAIPEEAKGKMDNWIFGCDVCQDVCPWNRFAAPTRNQEFTPPEKLIGFSKADWQDITEEVFSELFRRSAIKRTKLTGLKRNIAFNSEP